MTREEVRKRVVEKFFEEKPGPAKDETYNRYHYLVEKTKEGNIFLIRPANLKLGFDFRVDVDGMVFRKGTNAPTHIDIIEDLKKKSIEDKEFGNKVIDAILEVVDMKDPEEILNKIEDKNIGYSVELLLKLSKWLAIEMDIRYWNGWGRTKYSLWLNLMRLFKFKYEPTPKGFKYYDDEGLGVSEETAIKALNNSKQQLH
ncbi:DNA adenine methylase [Candidatus Woesearchaeota archaeon]|nr:DNA adenine methylase [Candidatus Woesearchaeota archaeon]